LNQYVKRIKGTKKLSEEQVMEFLELLVQFLKFNPQLMEKINSTQLMQLTCRSYLDNQANQMSPVQLAGMYWLCKNLGRFWDSVTLTHMEDRLVTLLTKEVALQKKLEGDYDADVPEGLQTWKMSDIESIENLYLYEESLASVTPRTKEILSLINQCKHWSRPEADRKWFHF